MLRLEQASEAHRALRDSTSNPYAQAHPVSFQTPPGLIREHRARSKSDHSQEELEKKERNNRNHKMIVEIDLRSKHLVHQWFHVAEMLCGKGNPIRTAANWTQVGCMQGELKHPTRCTHNLSLIHWTVMFYVAYLGNSMCKCNVHFAFNIKPGFCLQWCMTLSPWAGVALSIDKFWTLLQNAHIQHTFKYIQTHDHKQFHMQLFSAIKSKKNKLDAEDQVGGFKHLIVKAAVTKDINTINWPV